MIEDEETMHRVYSSISCEQKFAPTRSNCMQCKRKIIGFGKKNCNHCGTFICNRCSERKLDPSFFPPFCKKVIEIGEPSRVCNICADILITRKEEHDTIMGRELCFHTRQDDVSMLDIETTLRNQIDSPSQKNSNVPPEEWLICWYTIILYSHAWNKAFYLRHIVVSNLDRTFVEVAKFASNDCRPLPLHI